MLYGLHGLIWNLFLAALPVLFAGLLALTAERYRKQGKSLPPYVWLPLGLCWLAFLPNTCYLLTEWRHFLFQGLPHAYRTFEGREFTSFVAKDGLFFLLYSLAGCLCFALSIRPIERMLRKSGGKPALWAVPLFFLTSLGVYLGLVIRLNSWHIVTKPGHVLDVALRTLSDGQLVKWIAFFAVLLFLLYEIMDTFLDGVMVRLHRRHIHLSSLFSKGSSPNAAA